jgi:L,D-peptidoglycan transpeptidase YkuD (ErfK/YbiS/YcfS/YnhG family)
VIGLIGHRDPAAAGRPTGWQLAAGAHVLPVALGRGGSRPTSSKATAAPRAAYSARSGCGGVPTGTPPKTHLPVRAITPADAWSEDPADRHYNRAVTRKAGEAGDRLMREDHLYDFIIEIDHNTKPRIAKRGSAVFIHLRARKFGPTAGCVGLTGARCCACWSGSGRGQRS